MYEADQRHAEIIVGRLGLRGKRSVITPGVKIENQRRMKRGMTSPWFRGRPLSTEVW